MSELKEKLYQHCLKHAQERIDSLTAAINSAKESATEDTKSSAGDKYETGREMMQQETNRNTTLLNEASKLMVVLNRGSRSRNATVADVGSIVVTNNGNFYIAISAGTTIIDGQNYFTVSQASPIGMKLMKRKAGDSFEMNGKHYHITEVK